MGQKTDIKTIFQIGKNNKNYIWDSKYFEKQKNESNIFVFQNLEIRKFIEKILKDNGLALYNYKINFLESSIKIFISFIKLPKSQTIFNLISNNQKFRLVKNHEPQESDKKSLKNYFRTKKFIKKTTNFELNENLFLKKKSFEKKKLEICLLNNVILNRQKKTLKKKSYLDFIFIKKTQNTINKNFQINNLKNNQNILNKYLSNKDDNIKKRLKILQYYKYFIKLQNNKIIKNIKTTNFLEKILENLSIFTSNKFNIILNFQQINKNLNFNIQYHQLQYLKKITIQLRQFKKTKFFKEGLNTIFFSLIKKESSQLLANFIANQLKLVKRHGFFLKFVKKTLLLMLTDKFIKNTSIKIIIKGRFNGKRRASKKIITVNKYVSLTTIKSKIDFSQSTAFSSNGTFGVKLWVNKI